MKEKLQKTDTDAIRKRPAGEGNPFSHPEVVAERSRVLPQSATSIRIAALYAK